jgi:hypothetical protein
MLAVRKSYLVILVDGLGMANIRSAGGHASFLNQKLRSAKSLFSGFPATTTTSLTSLATGEPNGQHAVLGHRIYERELKQNINFLNDLGVDLDPQKYQNLETISERASAQGVTVSTIGPAEYDGSGFTMATMPAAKYISAESFQDRFRASLKALQVANYKQLRADQAARRASGSNKQLGIGVSVYVEITGGTTPGEVAKIEITPEGRAVVYTGTSPHGQGHVTSWSMIASEQTGIDMNDIDVVWGDTDLIPVGGGTMGSRSLQQGGAAVHVAAIELVEQARKHAAWLLEANEADVEFDKDNTAFHVAGTPDRKSVV